MSIHNISSVSEESVLLKIIADSYLEKGETSVHRVFKEFTAKGGQIHCLDNESKPFEILPGDVVFPSCSSGKNRSQTLWNIFRAHSETITLKPPHAVRGGYDPYNGKKKKWVDPVREQRKEERRPDGFQEWSGVKKTAKFGEDQFQGWWENKNTPNILAEMKTFYDINYYTNNPLNKNRKVYVTFNENAHVHLQRLSALNESLADVVVLFFIFPTDPLTCKATEQWWAETRTAQAYTSLSNIVSPCLDFGRCNRD